MEWQKEVITDSLPALMTLIDCNDMLFAELQKAKLIADTDIDQLNAIKEKIPKAERLLNILSGKKEGLKHLIKALHKHHQSGSVGILIEGIGSQVVSKDVMFEGVKQPMEKFGKLIGTERCQKIITSGLNSETFEQFLEQDSWTLATETIPKKIPYYIPRTLSINAQLDPEVFQSLKHDIFCIEGLNLDELSPLAKGRFNSFPDSSKKQIYELNTTLIHLEKHYHFDDIAKQTKQPVYWIKHHEGKYFYVKSSTGNGLQKVKKHLVSGISETLSEDQFVERSLNAPRNAPILIYDTPGMGKSVILEEIARKMKQKMPQSNVIFCPISDLVKKVSNQGNNLAVSVKQAILETITKSEISRNIMQHVLDSKNHQVELFLDAFDELQENDRDSALKILDCIAGDFMNIRVFITTRPHGRYELEEKFGVLGYNILPFDESNKLSFFLKYWETEHGVGINEGIKTFAKQCLETVNLKMSSEEGDIAGIPLQCRMLAEIWAKDADNGGDIPTEAHFQLKSIFKVYKDFIEQKFCSATFCSLAKKQEYYDYRVRESLRTIFPGNDGLFLEELPVPKDALKMHSKIYKIGILEPSKSYSSIPAFLHRTLAEYFAGEFLATAATLKFPIQSHQSDVINLLFREALLLSTDRWKQSNFQHPVVCRFLNFFLSTMHTPGQEFAPLKDALRESGSYTSDILFYLLECSLRINALNLYCYLLDLFLDLAESTNRMSGSLSFKHSLHDSSEWDVGEIKKGQLVNDLKKCVGLQNLVVVAAKHSSVSLVKLSCEFLDILTGKKFHEFPYDGKNNPMYFALQRGLYQMFEYLLSFDKDGFYQQPLLHWCLEYSSSFKNVDDKVPIVKKILRDKPDLLNKHHSHPFNRAPLHAKKAHFSLIKLLIEAGADLFQITERNKQNIAHLASIQLSADEYHELVKLIISRNACDLFSQRSKRKREGLTPFQRALQKIDLKTETIELLTNIGDVNPNDNSTRLERELAIAINSKRSKRVIEDIIRLGGDKQKLDVGTKAKLATTYNL